MQKPDAKRKLTSVFRTRLGVVAVLFCLAFCMVIGRLWQLQVTRYEQYRNLAMRDHGIEQIVPADRGSIYDRYGELLAAEQPVLDLSIRVERVPLERVTVKTLEELRERIDARKKTGPAAARMLAESEFSRLTALLQQERFVFDLARTIKREPLEIADGVLRALDIVAKKWASPRSPLRIASGIDERAWLALRAEHEDVFRDSYLFFGKSAAKQPGAVSPPFPGLVCTISARRVYPQGRLGCFVVGSVGELSQTDEEALRQDGILTDNAQSRRARWEQLRGGLDDARAASLERILRIHPSEIRGLNDLYGVLGRLRPADAALAGTMGLAEPLRWIQRPPRVQLTETEALWLGVGMPVSTAHNNLPSRLTGELGIERWYNDMLRGKCGLKIREPLEQQEDDASLKFSRSSQPRSGDSLALTISMSWQKAAERALHAQDRPGAVVVLDCRTGEVLALASWPDFDPNVFSPPRDGALRQEQLRSLLSDPGKPLLNRALSEQYPLGSCMKMLIAAVALEKGVVTPQETLECTGYIVEGGQKFHCDEGRSHGAVNLIKGLRCSCNVYYQQIGARIGVENLAPYAKLFFGHRMGIDLPAEANGVYPDREWRTRTFPNSPENRRWTRGNDFMLMIGQGMMCSTVIQAAVLTSAIGNGGWVLTPRLWLDAPHVPARSMGISPQNLALVQEGLYEVVNSARPGERGTACAAFHDQGPELAVHVAGKTSSAEHKKGAKPHAWFCGYAPAENPQVAFAVMLEEAGHGGSAAAPVAYKFLKEIYGTRSAPNPAPGAPRHETAVSGSGE